MIDPMDVEHDVLHSAIPQLLERLRTPASQRRQRRNEKFEFTHWNDFEDCWRKLHGGQAYNGQGDSRPFYNAPESFEGTDLASWLSLQNHHRSPHISSEGLGGTSPPRGRPSPSGSRPNSPENTSPYGKFSHDEHPLLSSQAFRIDGGRWRSDYEVALPAGQMSRSRPPVKEWLNESPGPQRERASSPPPQDFRGTTPLQDFQSRGTTPLHPVVDISKRVKPSFALQVSRHGVTNAKPERARGVLRPVPRPAPQPKDQRPVSRHSLSQGIPLPASRWGTRAPSKCLARTKQKMRSKSPAARGTEMRRGAGIDHPIVRSATSSGCHVQTHHLDFGQGIGDRMGGKRRLGAGSRVQGGCDGLRPADPLVVSSSGGGDEDEVFVVQYHGDRPGTRELDRILKRVVAPASMLSMVVDQ